MNAQFADKQGDRWSFVAVLPDTSFVHTIHHSKRTAEQAEVFLGKIKKKSDGLAPLFLSDAWFYEQALYKTYCRFEPRPYCGRGRPPHPLRIVDEKLSIELSKLKKAQNVSSDPKIDHLGKDVFMKRYFVR